MFQPGKSGNPAGRPVGRQNKFTADLQTMVLEALRRAGENIQKKHGSRLKHLEPGTVYLLEQAEKRPELFMPLIRQMMPAKIDLDVQVMSRDLVTLLSERRNQLAQMRDITPEETEHGNDISRPVLEPVEDTSGAGDGVRRKQRSRRRRA